MSDKKQPPKWRVGNYPLETGAQFELEMVDGAEILGVVIGHNDERGNLLAREPVAGQDGNAPSRVRRKFWLIGQGRTCEVDPSRLTLCGVFSAYRNQTPYALFEEIEK